MTKPTYDQLAAFNRKFGEIHRRFTEHHSYDDPEAVLDALQDIIFGKFPEPARPIDQFTRLLHSLEQQKQVLIEYGGLTETDFNDVDLTEPEEQRVSRLTILFYTTGDVKKDLRFYQRLLETRGLKVYNWFDVDQTELRLHELCVTYGPGVHRVVVDLTANWAPKDGRSVYQLFQTGGQTLSGTEGFAAYALQDLQLIQLQDGEALPYCDTAIQVRLGDWRYVVCFYWHRYDHEVALSSGPVGHVYQGWALPTVVRES